MSADVITFAPRPVVSTQASDAQAAKAYAQAALWHLSYATDPKATSHEFHTERAAEYAARTLYFARLAAQGGAR